MSAVTKHKYYSSPFTRHINFEDELTAAELAAIALAKLKTNGSNVDHSREHCGCVECKIGNKRFALHRPEDCAYTAARSALVPEAERIATARIKRTTWGYNCGARGNKWTTEFASEMDRLSAPLLNGSNGKSIAGDTNEATSIGTRVQAHDDGSNNGAHEQNGAQNGELNSGPLFSRPATPKNVQDATAAVVPIW